MNVKRHPVFSSSAFSCPKYNVWMSDSSALTNVTTYTDYTSYQVKYYYKWLDSKYTQRFITSVHMHTFIYIAQNRNQV